MTISLLGSTQKATIGFLELDASITETHTRTLEVTRHPVEGGADISDHAKLQPEEIEINGIVSNHPIALLASIQASSPIVGDLLPTNDRVETARAELERMQNEQELITVITSLREYTNMMIENMTITRNVSKGNVLDVSLTMREVRTVSLLALDVPVPVSASSANAVDGGIQNPPPAPPPEAAAATENSSSALFDIIS